MRKLLKLGVVTAALGLALAPAAEAHHLEQNTSTIACVLINNAPVIQIRAHFVQFTLGDQPISYDVRVDNVDAQSGQVPLNPTSDFFHSVDLPTTPGGHTVLYTATWNGGDNGGYFRTTSPLACPAPVPPDVCNGAPVPHGTPCAPPPPTVVGCNGQPVPPGTTPPVCTTPPPPKCTTCRPKPPKRCIPGHYRITVHPKHIDHGQVTFRLIGPRIKHVRWYVDHRRHARGGHAWEHTTHHGRRWSVYLWVQNVWGKTLWGRHRVTVTFDTRCGHRKLTLKYFNHDPISVEAQRELARAFRR